MIEHSEKLVAEVRRRALEFVVDNPRFGNELAAIEAAVLIGASIATELDESAIQLQAWQESFGTNQLTHALARLEAAEKAAKCQPKVMVEEESPRSPILPPRTYPPLKSGDLSPG